MINGKKIAVVLPAYDAAKTLEMTCRDITGGLVDHVMVDDCSRDDTAEVAHRPVTTVVHADTGHGENQKTCYRTPLKAGADIVVMVHPDYQYIPRLVPSMASMIAYGGFDAVIASRLLGVAALKGGMSLYKYVVNRVLTFIENILPGHKLSEYHSGYRAFSRRLPLHANSADFGFNNQLLAEVVGCGYRTGEVSWPTEYFADTSSINFRRKVIHGIGALETATRFRLSKLGMVRSSLFPGACGRSC